MRSFWFHYNKIASRAAGKPQLTVHYAGKCNIVDEIHCSGPTETRIRKTQPHVVVAGKTRGLVIKKGVAWL